jgi:hypothetical protein
MAASLCQSLCSICRQQFPVRERSACDGPNAKMTQSTGSWKCSSFRYTILVMSVALTPQPLCVSSRPILRPISRPISRSHEDAAAVAVVVPGGTTCRSIGRVASCFSQNDGCFTAQWFCPSFSQCQQNGPQSLGRVSHGRLGSGCGTAGRIVAISIPPGHTKFVSDDDPPSSCV